MLLDQPDHALSEHAALGGCLLLQPQQALDAQRQAMALPDGPHGRRRHADADQPKLLTDAQVAVGGVLRGHVQDLFLQLRRGLVGHARLAADARRQAFGAELLICFLDFVIVAAADAGQLAGLLDVLQLLGQGQQVWGMSGFLLNTEF